MALAAAALLAVPAWSQSSTGSVRGTVQDQTKAVIPNVTVLLTNTATGVELKTVSNEVGIYVFPSVVPGAYKVAAESAGMKKFEATATVQTQQSATIDITLQPSGTQTLVTVEDVTPVLTSDTATLSHTLERTRIELLPINGRSVMNLLWTVPGITQGSDGWRIFGARVGTHDVILDGAALTDQLYGGGSLQRMPSLDSIQEFHVEVNATSARFQRQASVILTTKGGTNQIHGSLFETNRDYGYGVARNRDNFTNTAAKLIRNEYGGTVGGPVWIPKLYDGKNRTFWFFNYEGYKLRSGGFGNYRVPTEAMRNGDFSGLVDSVGTFQTIHDPLTTGPAPNYLRQPFNYGGKINNIDPSRISPFAKYVYGILPLPNIPGANPLIGNNNSAPSPLTQNQYTWGARFDHSFGDRDHVYGRITKSMSSNYRPAANGVPTLDGFGNSRSDTYPNESLSLDWTHSFSPSWFNEFMFSASRTVTTSFSGDYTRRYSTELGLPNPGNQPGYPVVNNIGVGAGASNYFQPINWNMQYFNYFILENNGTKIKGKHEIQYGIHFRYDQLTYMPQQQRTAGNLSFVAATTALYDPVNSNVNNRLATANTGHVAAATYLGYSNYEVRVAKGKYYMHQNEDSMYIQDNFRATPRLTLNLGLRWQFSPYPNDKYYIMSGFDPKNMAIVLGNTLDTFYKIGATSPALMNVLTGYGMKFETWQEAGLPQRLVHNNWRDVGPHVGFAYRALEGRKSFVLRGGFSTSYNLIPIYGWNDRMRANTPFAGFYQNHQLTDSAQSPDRIGNWGLVNVPTIIAGKNSANAVTFDKPMGITPGTESFQIAYFNPHQPTSRVHDWNLTVEKEMPWNTVLRMSYTGNRASYQDSYDNVNEPMPTYVWVATKKLLPPTGIAANTATRPYPNLPFGNIQEYRKDGWGNSNGAQVTLERRYAKGIGFQVFYVLMNVNRAAANGWNSDSMVSPVTSFLPGAIPADHQERLRLLLYKRDTTVPKHEIRWNWVADLPFGKGKPLAGSANSFLNAVIGGWQIAGMGRWRSNYFTLPSSGIWPTGTPVEYYGHKYPIEDCRSGICRPGYLMWNGYIPAHQINSVDPRTGKPNGVMGVPANYKPAAEPFFPYPADYRNRNAANDPNYGNYGTNYIWLPVTDDTRPYRLNQGGSSNGSPLHPWINQAILSTNVWGCDASLSKSFSFKERARLRVQADFFNVFNVPGNPWSPGSDGVVGAWTNANTARVMQLSGRLTW
ncbi:MAG: TonB-dependent receptor [Acidobacteriota bacterium]